MGYSSQFRQEALRRLVEEDLTAAQVGREIGVSGRTVSRWAGAAGVALPRGQMGGTAGRVEEIKCRAVAWLHEGRTATEVAEGLGVRPKTVWRWARAAGIVLQQGRGGSLRRWQAVRREAMRLLGQGMCVDDVAAQAGVGPATLRRWHSECNMSVLKRGRTGGAATTAGHGAMEVEPPGNTGRGRRLSLAERVTIAGLLGEGQSAAEIGRRLGRDRSVISREINRGSVEGVYTAEIAESRAARRRARPKPTKLERCPRLRRTVIRWLNRKRSPEQIAGRLRLRHGSNEAMNLSHESIYQALYVQGTGALRQELKVEKALRTGRTARIPQSRLPRRSGRPWTRGANISDRPAEAEDRAVPGHWEGDLVIGTEGASALITLVERHSRFTMIHRLGDEHTAATVAEALSTMVEQLPAELLRSVTWDQGTEMAQVATFEVASGCKVYFCDPHSPWQRGTNENTNGLIREFFPKGTNFADVTDDDVRRVQDLLNDRPRKTLGYHKPCERLNETINGALTA